MPRTVPTPARPPTAPAVRGPSTEAYNQPAALSPAAPVPSGAAAARPPIARRPATTRETLKTRQGLRQAIIMSEILGKPLSLREPE
jgi:hypothetical protein